MNNTLTPRAYERASWNCISTGPVYRLVTGQKTVVSDQRYNTP